MQTSWYFNSEELAEDLNNLAYEQQQQPASDTTLDTVQEDETASVVSSGNNNVEGGVAERILPSFVVKMIKGGEIRMLLELGNTVSISPDSPQKPLTRDQQLEKQQQQVSAGYSMVPE